MGKLLYSIIIPHKNLPNLLQRCLDSIPQRDDMEVIIVDDSSDPGIVDFNNFPGSNREDVTVVFDKSCMGAGRARNIGLGHAKGRWILFADADDFFNYCLNDILNDYKDDDSDIIYFPSSSLDSDTYINTQRGEQHVSRISNYLEGGPNSEKMLRYALPSPWGKIIRKSLITDHDIFFQETRINNDVKFNYMVGYYARTIKADKRAAYCVTYRSTSITYSLTEGKILDKMRVSAEEELFYLAHHIDLPPYFFHTYIRTIIDFNVEKQKDLYDKCLNVLMEYGISPQQVKSMIASEKRRRIIAKVRSRLAVRSRIRKLSAFWGTHKHGNYIP